MTDKRVYEELRSLIEEYGGTMKFEREGSQWGHWIVKVDGYKEKSFSSSGSGFPELDNLYIPKDGVVTPNHWSDYSNTLIPNAWEKLLMLLSE